MKKRKKRKSGPASKNSRKKKLRSPEVFSLLLIIISLFAFISLISYDARDPSWASVTTPGHSTRNYGGKAGAYLAEGLLQLFGLSAFLLSLSFGYLGIKALLPRGEKRLLRRLGGSLLLIILLCALFSLLFHSFTWHGAEIQSGGLLGEILSSFLVRYFSQVGSLIFLLALILLFILFSTEFSLGRLVGFFARFLSFAFKNVRIQITHYKKSKAKDKMRKKVIEKYTQTTEKSPKEEIGKEAETADRKFKKTKEAKKELKKGERPEPVLIEAVRPEKLLFPEMEKKGDYNLPPFTLLDPGAPAEQIDKDELYEKKTRIEEKLREFRVDGEVK